MDNIVKRKTRKRLLEKVLLNSILIQLDGELVSTNYTIFGMIAVFKVGKSKFKLYFDRKGRFIKNDFERIDADIIFVSDLRHAMQW